MTRIIAIKSLVLIEEVAFSNEAAINIAVPQINHAMAVIMYVSDLLTRVTAQSRVEYQEMPMT